MSDTTRPHAIHVFHSVLAANNPGSDHVNCAQLTAVAAALPGGCRNRTRIADRYQGGMVTIKRVTFPTIVPFCHK